MTNQELYEKVKTLILSSQKWAESKFNIEFEKYKKVFEDRIGCDCSDMLDTVAMGLAEKLGIDMKPFRLKSKLGDRVLINAIKLQEKPYYLKGKIVAYVGGIRTSEFEYKKGPKKGSKGNMRFVSVKDESGDTTVQMTDIDDLVFAAWSDIKEQSLIEIGSVQVQEAMKYDDDGKLVATGKISLAFNNQNAIVQPADPVDYPEIPSFVQIYTPPAMTIFKQQSDRFVLNITLLELHPKIVTKRDNDKLYSVQSQCVVKIGADVHQCDVTFKDLNTEKHPNTEAYWAYWQGSVYGYYNHESNILAVDTIIAQQTKITNTKEPPKEKAPVKPKEPEQKKLDVPQDAYEQLPKIVNEISIIATGKPNCFGSYDTDLSDCQECKIQTDCKAKPKTPESSEGVYNESIANETIAMLAERDGKGDHQGVVSFLGMRQYDKKDIAITHQEMVKKGLVEIANNKMLLKKPEPAQITMMTVNRANCTTLLDHLKANDKDEGWTTKELTDAFLVDPSKVLAKLKKDKSIYTPKEGFWRRMPDK